MADQAVSLAFKIASWGTVMGIDALVDFFHFTDDDRMGRWAKEVRGWTITDELGAVQSLQGEFQESIGALSTSISALSTAQQEGTTAVLETLFQLRDDAQWNKQREYLKKATDAMKDIRTRRYHTGNPRNVELLKTAADKAQKAARVLHSSTPTKLQAYRVWIIAEYLHEVANHQTCKEAKRAVLYIVREILEDNDLLLLCRQYAGLHATTSLRPEDTRASCSASSLSLSLVPTGNKKPFDLNRDKGLLSLTLPTEGKSVDEQPERHRKESCDEASPRLDGSIQSSDMLEALIFLMEIMSSVTLMPPLDEDVTYEDIVTVIGTNSAKMKAADGIHVGLMGGELKIGQNAPREVMFAMGKYCAGHPEMSKLYPSVSALALAAWEQGKEQLALDHFYTKMGGDQWLNNSGWEESNQDLCYRYGVSIENGHVVKIHLAANNLIGELDDSIVDCDHLREIVLHGNKIQGDVPPRVQHFITSKSDLLVTGFPEFSRPSTADASAGAPSDSPSSSSSRSSSQKWKSTTTSVSSTGMLKMFGKWKKSNGSESLAGNNIQW